MVSLNSELGSEKSSALSYSKAQHQLCRYRCEKTGQNSLPYQVALVLPHTYSFIHTAFQQTSGIYVFLLVSLIPLIPSIFEQFQ